jgi:D-alanyl-D-alanine dipeptidase/carboxypeptidase
MKPVRICSDSVHSGNLMLVNAGHPFTYGIQSPLVQVRGSNVFIDLRASVMLAKLMERAGGGQILTVSGYRSFEEQRQIWDDSVEKNGLEFTKKYVAKPGCSEHHTGLAVDLALASDKIDFIRPDFPNDGVCGTFRQLAPRYGFVERYAEGKESITGIAHEPWHFRYVGYPHSMLMHEMGLTLEEYVDLLRLYPLSGEHLRLNNGRYAAEVFFVNEDEHLVLPEDTPIQMSGNNVDGLILTIWRTSE